MTFGLRKTICRIHELRMIGTIGICSQLPTKWPALFCEEVSKYRVAKCSAAQVMGECHKVWHLL